MISLLWLRRDLRVHDHPAVHAASAGAERLAPVLCLDDDGRHRFAAHVVSARIAGMIRFRDACELHSLRAGAA